MEQVATILGVTLPVLSARQTIKLSCSCPRTTTMSRTTAVQTINLHSKLLHEDSLTLICKGQWSGINDDDTVSTVSEGESDSSLDSSEFSLTVRGPSVSFAQTLVSEIHTRPYTTLCEKYALFYSDYDYMEFRRDAYFGDKRDKVVKFAEEVVTDEWTVPAKEAVAHMYYTESELQGFLDEFIASLDQSYGIFDG